MGMSSPSFIITSLGDDPLIDDKRRVECQPPSVGYIKLMVKQWWAIIDVMNLMTQSGRCIDMTMIWVIYEIVYAQSVRKDWMIRVKGYIIIMQQSNGDVCLDEVSDRDPKKIMSLSIIKCGIVTIHAICWYVWILIAKTNTSCEKRYMSTKQHPSSNTTIYRL